MELDILRKNIKESLQDLMLKRNLNLVNFSREIKIEYKTLANYAQGVFAPNLKNAIKIVDFFGCSLDFLVGISDEEDFGNYSTPTLNFYEIYKKELKSQNITHYRLTKDTDINVNDVAKWKTGSIPTSNYYKGEYMPSIKNAIKLADFFNCSLDLLVGLSDEEGFGKYTTPTLNFYEIYKKELGSQNLSHYRLAKDTNINMNDTEKWKKGSIPSLANLIKIADYLSVSIDSLIGREKIKE